MRAEWNLALLQVRFTGFCTRPVQTMPSGCLAFTYAIVIAATQLLLGSTLVWRVSNFQRQHKLGTDKSQLL